MHMRFFLPGLIRAAAFVLDGLRGGSQRAIGPDRQRGVIATAIIGDDGPFAASVDTNISGIVTSACLLIDEREFPGGLVEGEGAYAAGLRTVRFVHGIDEFPI